MAITVDLYTFSKKTNSTAQPGGSPAASFNCTLKDETSFLSPQLMLSASNPTAYNYAYISTFGRYYWISDWESLKNGIWLATLQVDALASFKTNIGSSSQYVLRSASSFDGSIKDEYYPIKLSHTYTIVGGASTPFAQDFNSGVYIVGCVGTGVTGIGGVIYYELTPAQFRGVVKWLLDNPLDPDYQGDVDGIQITSEDVSLIPNFVVKFLSPYYKTMINPIQYITSAMWFPVAPTGVTVQVPVRVGWWKTDVNGFPLDSGQSGQQVSGSVEFEVFAHPQAAARGSYLNTAPYTTYRLYFGPFGEIELDSVRMASINKIYCYFHIDFVTGVGYLTVNDVASELAPIATVKTKVGVSVSLSSMQTDVSKMALMQGAQKVDAITNAIAAPIRSLFGAGSIPETAANVVTNTIGTIAETSANPEQRGSSGSMVDYALNPRLVISYNQIADDNNAEVGKPLCKIKTISSLSGYIQCSDGDLAIAATQEEIDSIKSYLKGGFYYE